MKPPHIQRPFSTWDLIISLCLIAAAAVMGAAGVPIGAALLLVLVYFVIA